jgi:hypothetical protein
MEQETKELIIQLETMRSDYMDKITAWMEDAEQKESAEDYVARLRAMEIVEQFIVPSVDRQSFLRGMLSALVMINQNHRAIADQEMPQQTSSLVMHGAQTAIVIELLIEEMEDEDI